MNKDYELKVEEVSPETLLEAAQLLQRKLRKENREIIFYHLDKEYEGILADLNGRKATK